MDFRVEEAAANPKVWHAALKNGGGGAPVAFRHSFYCTKRTLQRQIIKPFQLYDLPLCVPAQFLLYKTYTPGANHKVGNSEIEYA